VSPVRYELGFYIPEDGILHSHRRENLKSYNQFFVCFGGMKGPGFEAQYLRFGPVTFPDIPPYLSVPPRDCQFAPLC
jgi:hypothetical protein